MIKIDFHGSTHGHFLEYVSNVYIMQTPPSKRSIFKPPTYSAHNPDQDYIDGKIIECGHYSSKSYNLKIDPTKDTVIRIQIDSADDDLFYVALTNLMYKAGDVGFERQILSIPDYIRNNAVGIRNNWYSKINERSVYAAYYEEFTEVVNPTFNFPFRAFFSFTEFCRQLSEMSKFLDQTFYPDQSLYDLWVTFIQVNQGWQSYSKCNNLLVDIFSGKNTQISCTSLEQAWINFNLSKICRLYDGILFEQEDYPSDTKSIYNIVQKHLASK